MKRRIICIILTILVNQVISQTHEYKINNYNNQTISTCNGIFLDDGGQGHWMSGTYYHQNTQDYTTTICNPNPSDSIFLKLFAFKSGASLSSACPDGTTRDLLNFYAGTNSSGQCLFSISGKNVFSNYCDTNNPTAVNNLPMLMSNLGCITVVWHADCSNNAMGWEIGITCERPKVNDFSDASSSCDPSQLPASDVCANAPIVSLDKPICGSTANSFTPETEPALTTWCDNYGPAYKSSWLSFIADTTFVSFQSYVKNCTGGSLGMATGIQMQIFETTDCQNFTQKSNCLATGALSGTGIPLNLRGGQDGFVYAENLTPGNRYYILIGGYLNDVCDYSLVPSKTNPKILLNLIPTPDTCAAGNKGTIQATTSGTKIAAPFTYTWSPASGTPTQPFAAPDLTPLVITGLAAGTYTVTVTDNNGISATATTTITGTPLISTAPAVVHTQCGQNTGSITFTIPSSGTPSYQYSIDGGTTYSANLNFPNLPSGSYSGIIKDNVGCTNPYPITINPSTGITVSTTWVNEKCTQMNGSITANVTGGVTPYSYKWNTNPEKYTQAITNISAGTYTVTATDASGCTNTTTRSIIDSGVVNVQVNTTTAHCSQADGSATAVCTGLTTNLNYTWDNSPAGTTATINNLLPGTYAVTVTNGVCSTNSQGTVGNAPGPTAKFKATPPVAKIENATISFIDQSQGNFGDWNWNFGDSTTSTNQSPNHTYNSVGLFTVSLLVTDIFGCADSTTQIVKINDILTFYIPNAFIPDNNGLNEIFKPKGRNFKLDSYSMYIYDRWGELIFSTTNFEEGWNGTLHNKGSYNEVIEGVYVYKIDLIDEDNHPHSYVGKVSLIR